MHLRHSDSDVRVRAEPVPDPAGPGLSESGSLAPFKLPLTGTVTSGGGQSGLNHPLAAHSVTDQKTCVTCNLTRTVGGPDGRSWTARAAGPTRADSDSELAHCLSDLLELISVTRP